MRTAARFGGPLCPPAEPHRSGTNPGPLLVHAHADAATAATPGYARPTLRHAIVTVLAVIAIPVFALLAVPAARAEEVFTGQSIAARATDSTWIPAPQERAAVCVVDTGAGNSDSSNPDLDNVVARLAVDGASPDDLNPGAHGTLMAMIAAAPHNDFGMVGAAPSISVVSVRASRDGQTFGSADLTTAIQKCVLYRSTYNIKVISLSLGGAVNAGLDRASMGATQDAVDNARRAGLDVVAAAGNHPGAVDWPAGYGPVLAIGAADHTGAMCAFSASGPEVDLWASGCPQDVALPDGRAAWATGSSEATAFVAAVLAQLRGLRPDLSVDAAEASLTAHSNPTDAGSSLDVDAAFRSAGLSGQLASGHAAIPAPPVLTPSDQETTPQPTTDAPALAPAPQRPSSPPDSQPPDTTTPGVALQPIALTTLARAQLPAPSVRSARLRRNVLTIEFKNKPKGIQVRVGIYARKKGRAFPTLARSLRVTGDRLRTRVSGTLSQVSITYRDPTGARAPSSELTVHPRT